MDKSIWKQNSFIAKLDLLLTSAYLSVASGLPLSWKLWNKSLLAGIRGLFDIEMTPANMMLASGASSASSSGVNQAPLPLVPQPQPPATELDGGGTANKNVEVGLFCLRKAQRVTTLTNPSKENEN